MVLNWNEIKSRALRFSKTWADASNEDSQAKPFWLDFFEIFGITNKRVATFELHVKKLGGAQGFVDLFWPGVLLVEHKSRGKNLDDAVDQAIGYLPNQPSGGKKSTPPTPNASPSSSTSTNASPACYLLQNQVAR